MSLPKLILIYCIVLFLAHFCQAKPVFTDCRIITIDKCRQGYVKMGGRVFLMRVCKKKNGLGSNVTLIEKEDYEN